jgi:hypothetical protein
LVQINRRLPMVLGVVLTVILLLSLSIPLVFADNGGGKAGGGGGTGGGSEDPLALVSATPEDGAVNVMQPLEIKLVFNKNVAHMSVHDSNAQKFSLSAPNGVLVPLIVQIADDQIEPEKRNDVILIPKEQLASDTIYTIIISAGLESKSNTVLAQDIKLTFRTAAAPAPVSTSDTAAAQSELPQTSSAIPLPVVVTGLVLVLAGIAVMLMSANRLRWNKK